MEPKVELQGEESPRSFLRQMRISLRQRVTRKVEDITRLGRDLKHIWACRQLIYQPFILTIIFLGITYLLKRWVPGIFMDLGSKGELFGAVVFVPLSLLHGILLTNVFNTFSDRNANIVRSLRKKDLQLFKDYFFQRVAMPLKVVIFFLSIFICYSVASCDLGSEQSNYTAMGMTYFIILLAWLAAYEMDDPFSTAWDIRPYIPKKWWDEIAADIEGSPEMGRIRLRDILIDEQELPEIANDLVAKQE